ncbi:hypothetical protein QNJ25_06425 [Macrococcus caseolyticus]|uniref:hypothetical protein n=1 Tax=Macrococcoides caseolyticum TaxID=69966 RepID=UPI0024BCD1BB|nr:hypothetical protein [Macrococcus caseolyticus]MDJ1153553.1 hypothetical protein [Macrococcus caseolyticus]
MMTRNLNINAMTTIAAGEYDEIKVTGIGSVTGDIKADLIKVSGKMDAEGDISVRDFKVSGMTSIEGSLKADTMKTSGKTNVEGSIEGNDVHVSGMLDVEGNITGERLKVSGYLTVEGDIEVDHFECSGKIESDGLINAESINITLGNNCSTQEIGGKEITILDGKTTDNKGLFASFFTENKSGKLSCDLIEGDEIRLENVLCDVVRGKNIIIGKGCIIDKVEYTNTIEVIENATTNEQIKI